MLKYKKKKAVFTIVNNEEFFMPLWCRYYGEHFNVEDIYVLDHNSTDGSTDNIPVGKVVRLNYPVVYDNTWLLKVVMDFQKELLSQYKYVLFTHVDEFVVPRPSLYSNFDEYISTFKEEYATCIGREILHMPDESDFDSSKSILEQRQWWFRNESLYNKTLFSRMPLDWHAGWHNHDGNDVVDNDLYLLHLHRIDYKECYLRHQRQKSLEHSLPDKAKDWDWHQLIRENAEFAKWFYCVESARILNASQSKHVFNQYKKKTMDEVYANAIEACEKIPVEWRAF